MACSQGQGEVAVQRQSLIEGFRSACLRTEDAINSQLVPFCSFWTVSSDSVYGYAHSIVYRLAELRIAEAKRSDAP